MDKLTHGICQECNAQFDYVLNPKYPRKYCFECSDKKKAEYEGFPSPKPLGTSQVASQVAEGIGVVPEPIDKIVVAAVEPKVRNRSHTELIALDLVKFSCNSEYTMQQVWEAYMFFSGKLE